MDRLQAMSVVVAVMETGSFSGASRRLGIPVATISRKVADLEERLKAELFQRSSRGITVTDAGQSYIDACRRIMDQVEEAEREVSGEYLTPKGDLAVTAPWGLGHMHLLPLSVEFRKAYPEVSLRLILTDRVVNTAEENIDVSIRIGPLAESSMIASRLAAIRLVMCASPAYLAARGTPKTPHDLPGHDCITVDSFSTPGFWQCRVDRQIVAAPIQSKLCVSTSEAAIQAAIAGAGLARVMSYKMEAARQAGQLVTVLEAYELEPMPAHIVYAPRKIMPLKLRAFLDWMTPRLKARLQAP
jgi:DNA-binding transcriptional LysR family regulator